MRARRSPRRIPAVGLLGGTLLVHQLRFLAGYGSHASQALADQGHGYLDVAGPAVGMLLALATGAAVGRVLRAWQTGEAGARSAALRHAWPVVSAALLGVYAAQESLEGLLSAGHPAGAAALLAGSGWCVLPIALAVGGALALLLRATDVVAAAAAARSAPGRRTSPAAIVPATTVLVAPARRPRHAPLADRGAGRAPPFAAAIA